MPDQPDAAAAPRMPFGRSPLAWFPWRATTPAASTAVFVATFAVIGGLIALLLVFDLWLARIDQQASRAHADAEYAAGLTLLAHGRAAAAAEHFGTAVAVDRDDLGYALALARARLAEGRTADARVMVQGLLERAENDGAVNLVMAHALLAEGRPDEATSYFHRAIFGRWGADSLSRRAQARSELIDVLARRGATQALLAELLPLEETPPDSVALRRRLGQLFIVAGAPARGAAVLRDVLRRDPQDADAYTGMGDAALALGKFRTARADFARAAQLRPSDARLAARLALADTVLALDPAARGIGGHARYLRSRELLSRTAAALAGCAGAPALRAQLDSAGTTLASPVRPSAEENVGQAMVARAGDLWSARPPTCGDGDAALAIVLDRIGP